MAIFYQGFGPAAILIMVASLLIGEIIGRIRTAGKKKKHASVTHR